MEINSVYLIQGTNNMLRHLFYQLKWEILFFFMQFTLLLCIFEEYVTFSINLIMCPW